MRYFLALALIVASIPCYSGDIRKQGIWKELHDIRIIQKTIVEDTDSEVILIEDSLGIEFLDPESPIESVVHGKFLQEDGKYKEMQILLIRQKDGTIGSVKTPLSGKDVQLPLEKIPLGVEIRSQIENQKYGLRVFSMDAYSRSRDQVGSQLKIDFLQGANMISTITRGWEITEEGKRHDYQQILLQDDDAVEIFENLQKMFKREEVAPPPPPSEKKKFVPPPPAPPIPPQEKKVPIEVNKDVLLFPV